MHKKGGGGGGAFPKDIHPFAITWMNLKVHKFVHRNHLLKNKQSVNTINRQELPEFMTQKREGE